MDEFIQYPPWLLCLLTIRVTWIIFPRIGVNGGKDAFETTTYVSNLNSVTLLRIFDVPPASAHLFFNSSMPKKCCWCFRKSGKPINITLSSSLSFHPFTTCFERIDSRITNSWGGETFHQPGGFSASKIAKPGVYWVHMSSPPKKTVNPKLGGGPKNAWKIRRDESCCRSTNPTENCPAIRHHLSTVIVEQAEVQGAVVLWGNTQEPARWVFWCFLMSLVKGRGNANVGIAWHCLLISNVWIWNTLNLQNDSTKKPYNKEH